MSCSGCRSGRGGCSRSTTAPCSTSEARGCWSWTPWRASTTISQAIASVTDKPVTAAVYPHYHADHIGDIGKYVGAAEQQGRSLRIVGSAKTAQAMEKSHSSFPRPTEVLDWPRGEFDFEGLTVELHGFEWAAHTDDHAAWLLADE